MIGQLWMGGDIFIKYYFGHTSGPSFSYPNILPFDLVLDWYIVESFEMTTTSLTKKQSLLIIDGHHQVKIPTI
jgi:hypothetical protein